MTLTLVEPLVQKLGSVCPKSLPSVPLVTIQPVAGVMVHTVLPATHPDAETLFVGKPALVNVTGVLTHAVSFPKLKVATAACET